jgi:hypothetical protein
MKLDRSASLIVNRHDRFLRKKNSRRRWWVASN